MYTRLSELLKGCEIVKSDGVPVVQTIGPMQIAFLTASGEFVDDSYGNPLKVVGSNKGYGNLTLANREDSSVIVPAQIAVFQKGAQNHAMMKAAYIGASSSRTFNDASCVEGSQTGHINPGNQEIRMVPLLLRGYMFETAGEHSFYKSYSQIEKMHAILGVDGGSNYLDRYFSKYGNELEKFIAHFELPRSNVIGFIVLVNGSIVAVDKFPNFKYPGYLWELIVRDCYASLAIALGKVGYSHPMIDIVDDDMLASEDPVEYLRAAVQGASVGISNQVVDSIRALGEVEFSERVDRDGGAADSRLLSGNYMRGQAISRTVNGESVNVYVSLVRSGLLERGAIESLVNAANVRRISSKQKPFAA